MIAAAPTVRIIPRTRTANHSAPIAAATATTTDSTTHTGWYSLVALVRNAAIPTSCMAAMPDPATAPAATTTVTEGRGRTTRNSPAPLRAVAHTPLRQVI